MRIRSLKLPISQAKKAKTERSLKHAFHGKDVALIQVVEAELIGSLRHGIHSDIQIGLKNQNTPQQNIYAQDLGQPKP